MVAAELCRRLLRQPWKGPLLGVLIFSSALLLLWNNHTAASPRHPRWISALQVGNLGNELFDVAATLGLGRRHGLEVLVAGSSELCQIFQLPANMTAYDRVADMPGTYQLIQERAQYDCKYDEQVSAQLPPPGGAPRSALLWGYFQSWKYFRDVTGELTRLLTFKPSVMQKARSFLQSELSRLQLESADSRAIVGVHVRRGDMLSDARLREYGYTEVPASYFEHAAQYFRDTLTARTLVFVICSDDLDWSKQHLSQLDVNVVFSEKHAAAVDLAILSLSDHVVVSTGTFGWWGAWLSSGSVVYYKLWPRNDSELDRAVNKQDYFPPAWIPME